MGCRKLTYHQEPAIGASWKIFTSGKEKTVSTSNFCIDYYTFGVQMPGRNGSTGDYRYGFNGMEKDDEVKGNGNSYDFGARMHDPRVGRFLSIDPQTNLYPAWSPYIYAMNDPVRFIDFDGRGPGDRVKKAKEIKSTDPTYSQKKGENQGSELRSGISKKALQYMDCSELVCRVLAADGTTPKVELLNTSGLKSRLNSNDYHKSNSPEVGDVFLWRVDKP